MVKKTCDLTCPKRNSHVKSYGYKEKILEFGVSEISLIFGQI